MEIIQDFTAVFIACKSDEDLIKREGKSPDHIAIFNFGVYFNQYHGYIETEHSKMMHDRMEK